VRFLKERLDVLLAQRDFFPSREKAKAAIMAGMVFVDGLRADKAGTPVKADVSVEIRGSSCPYVSRGGLKLEGALKEFDISVKGIAAVDIGASTGGFTDCLLQNGAERVFAVDVGYGQLDWKLRNDPRVVILERTNVRYLDTALIPCGADLVTIDVSFISLKLVFPVAKRLLAAGGKILCLVKPQFEAGRRQVGNKGIVRDAAVHRETLASVVGYAAENGLCGRKLAHSAVRGAKGNVEFFLLLESGGENGVSDAEIGSAVALAHEQRGNPL
jgi:23S rRNA (cytidine1920-2'-O)/16S rRNA (cytidine1409-2'-O)-methyltransferase